MRAATHGPRISPESQMTRSRVWGCIGPGWKLRLCLRSIFFRSGDAGGGTIETERSGIHVGRRAWPPDRIAGQVCAARGLRSLLLVTLFFAKKR